MSNPKLIFGCATVGYSFTNTAETSQLLDIVKSTGITTLDTAARYPPSSPGLSEKLLGSAGAVDKGFAVDTKINVFGNGEGCLAAPAIEESLNQSLTDLSEINVLYCHAPDNKTPLEEQAAAFDMHFKKGKFKYLGVSNFSVNMIEKWMQISEQNGFVKPSVYQGQYNLICRGLETRLFPTLRKFNMSFVAFAPLAGGFLTGKFKPSSAPHDMKSTRFELSDDNPFGKASRHWYDKNSMHQAISNLESICSEHKISMLEASLRWLQFHSALKADDSIILGASKASQVLSNTAALKNGPLVEELVDMLNDLWSVVETDAISINP